MNLKKYSLGSYLSIALISFNCSNECASQASEEEKDYYTANHYKLPSYAPEAFRAMVRVYSPDEISSFRKKLETNIPKWVAGGTEEEPYKIWEVYRREVFKKLEAFDALKNYFDKFGNLMQKPTESNEKEMIAAITKLQADTKANQLLKDLASDVANMKLSEPILAYQECLYFILDKDTPGIRLHLRIKQLHAHLAAWKADNHPLGLELWNDIKAHKRIKDFVSMQYKENQDAIVESLKIVDQLANSPDPYGLTCNDFQVTLPHGFKLLNTILNEVELQEESNVKLLKAYYRRTNIKYVD